MSDPRILVTLCTYNERDNISLLVPQIRQVLPEADVLVIDDNSPDGTGRVADELAAADGRIRVLHRPGKEGLGAAMLAGFRHAISHGYDFVLNMDADFSHDPRHLRISRLHAKSRRGDWLAIRPRRRHRRMGVRPALHEPGNQLVRATPLGALHPRQ